MLFLVSPLQESGMSLGKNRSLGRILTVGALKRAPMNYEIVK